MQPLVIIIGPTAVGKSALGVELALELNGEIISGDSVQVYRRLDVGSAKPTKVEQKGIVHHLIDILDPAEPFTAARFQILTRELIFSVREKNKVPILVGGTGLYIRSLLDDFDFPVQGSDSLKTKWLTYARTYGNIELHHVLFRLDPASAERLHPNDTARIIRALEVAEITGRKLSEQRSYLEKEYPKLDSSVIYIGLEAPREIIYERINKRCEDMVKHGIINEVSQLLREGYNPKLKSLRSIGYRHTVCYLQGLVTLEEMVRLFQRDTRRFAKRQLTWFRRDPRIQWYNIAENRFERIIKNIVCTCRDFQSRVQ